MKIFENKIINDYIEPYKIKINNLKNLDKYDEDYIMLFDGQITKSLFYSEIINKTKDLELIDLCKKVFPHNFLIEKSKLVVQKQKIRTLKFTKDQKKGCKKFVEFLIDPNKKTFGLYGFSGTGKTTTLVEIVSYLLSNRLIKSVVFSAPTNKAVNVMKNKFEKYAKDIYCIYSEKLKNEIEHILFEELILKLHEYGIYIDFLTIHKLLNFDSEYDIDGKLCFNKKSLNSDIEKYNLVIIDECSMLPAMMVDSIFTDIRNNKNKEIKIVFSGDVAQLPPVNEKNSIIFSKLCDDFPFESYLNCYNIDKDDIVQTTCFKIKYEQLINEIISFDNFVMKDVVRSKSNNVLGICTTIRIWTLENKEKFKIGKFIDSVDCHAYKYIKFSSKISSSWFKTFVNQCLNKQDCIILTWTNKQCDEYNNNIRKELFKNDNLDKFVIGDILMLGNFYNLGNNNDDNSNKFYTSEQIEVVDVKLIDKKIKKFPSSLNKETLKLEHGKIYDDHYKLIIDEMSNNVKKSYKCWELSVKRLFSNKSEISTIYIIHDSYENVHIAEKGYIEGCVKKLRKKLVAKYREKASVIENNIIQYCWKQYHNIYIEPFGDVNYGYCITCHKAQGSTFYNVFVDLNDILKNNNINEMKRCLYTAISRTSNELHLLA
jgi:ABC-type dipeptide/oligopeptide/nickel transport system ATPase component